jgi:hypothetical protein
MQKKKCSRCEETKIISDFNRRGKGYQGYCRDCSNIVKKQHYLNNKQDYINKAKKVRKKTKDTIADIKAKAGCLYCEESHPACLDFDHRDPEEKLFGICEGIASGYSIKKLLKEIDKCDVVCSNCHRKRHWT